MINRVVLVGRITKDPELKTTTGTKFCSFNIVVDDRKKNADGTKKANFFPCIAFGVTAESMCKFTKKGKMIGVEGRLSQRSFTRQDGSQGSITEIVCDSVQFLERVDSVKNVEPDTPPFEESTPAADEENKNLASLDVPESDLPF